MPHFWGARFASNCDPSKRCNPLQNQSLIGSVRGARLDAISHSEPPKVVIKSVNPEYQTYERDAEEVNIIGRVIWAAKRL